MRSIYTILFIAIATVGCKTGNKAEDNALKTNISIAHDFINAFYSFNTDSLKTILAHAESSQPNILYYQKWAECGHYEIVKRGPFTEKDPSTVSCPVTVKDDLMAALKIDFNVTDTFEIRIENGVITSVTTSSNDLEDYYEGKDWVKKNRPQYVEKQCEGIWEGGPTPCECVQGMVKGFVEFTTERSKQ